MLDVLHRCLTNWLAPVLVFTSEEAWCARFGEDSSVHLQDFPALPAAWSDASLGARWTQLREHRRLATLALEQMRRDGKIGSSLQAVVTLGSDVAAEVGLSPEAWAEILIVPSVNFGDEGSIVTAALAPGEKCARCWKVLPEVGSHARHPTLCLRCDDAVDSGLVARLSTV